jgi:hypothetical protein
MQLNSGKSNAFAGLIQTSPAATLGGVFSWGPGCYDSDGPFPLKTTGYIVF